MTGLSFQADRPEVLIADDQADLLAARLAADRHRGASAIRDRLVAALRAFSGGRRDDDQTMVILCRQDGRP